MVDGSLASGLKKETEWKTLRYEHQVKKYDNYYLTRVINFNTHESGAVTHACLLTRQVPDQQ